MVPPERMQDRPGSTDDAATEALRTMSPDLVAYAEAFFATPELRPATDAVIASLRDTSGSEAATVARLEAWLLYSTASEAAVDGALLTGGSEAVTQAQISAIIHKAMIFKAVGNAIRYFGELKMAEEYAYQEDADDDFHVDETLYDELDKFLAKTGLSFEGVQDFVLTGNALTAENQRSMSEDIYNGFALQDVLGGMYEMLIKQGDDPEAAFRQCGFPDSIPA